MVLFKKLRFIVAEKFIQWRVLTERNDSVQNRHFGCFLKKV